MNHAVKSLMLLVLLVLVAGACRERTTKQDRSTDEALRQVALDDRAKPTPRAEEAPFHLLKFNLETAGEAPRTVLRYRRPDGVSARARAVASLTVDDRPITIETGLAITGKATRLGLVGLAAAGDSNPSTADYDQLVSGARAAADLTDRGLLLRVGGVAPIDSRRELAAMLIRHLAPLPVEAIGVGARWRVRYAISRGGVFIAQTSTYELVERGGSKLRLRVTRSEAAEPQPILRGSVVLGELVGLSTTTTGEIEIDLGHPLIDRATLTSQSTFHARHGRDEIFRETETQLVLSTDNLE